MLGESRTLLFYTPRKLAVRTWARIRHHGRRARELGSATVSSRLSDRGAPIPMSALLFCGSDDPSDRVRPLAAGPRRHESSTASISRLPPGREKTIESVGESAKRQGPSTGRARFSVLLPPPRGPRKARPARRPEDSSRRSASDAAAASAAGTNLLAPPGSVTRLPEPAGSASGGKITENARRTRRGEAVPRLARGPDIVDPTVAPRSTLFQLVRPAYAGQRVGIARGARRAIRRSDSPTSRPTALRRHDA